MEKTLYKINLLLLLLLYGLSIFGCQFFFMVIIGLAEEVPVTSSQAILEIATAKAREFQRLEDLHTNLSGDDISLSPGLLHPVIEEFLDNAFQFSQPGTPVQLEIQQTPKEIGIYVHDRGCGMTEEQLAAPDRTYGLGLLVCRLLTELSDGTLTIHSEQGRGTTVAVIFKGA
jgi:signal transduction histidine kinase